MLESALSSAALLSAFQQCESERQAAAMATRIRLREERRAAALERRRARARENVRRMQAAAAHSLAALAAPPERLRLVALDQTAQGQALSQLPRGPLSRVRLAAISPRHKGRVTDGGRKVTPADSSSSADKDSQP